MCHAACPDNYAATSGSKNCVKNTHACTGNADSNKASNWKDDNGTCVEKCPDYDVEDSAKFCHSPPSVDTCHAEGKVLSRAGVCVAECPAYDFKNVGTKKCEAKGTCNLEA